VLTTHNKELVWEIFTQQASSSSIPSRKLLSKPDHSPIEQCNAMILRGVIEGPKGISNDANLCNDVVVEKEVFSPFSDVSNDVENAVAEVPKDPKQTSL